jgi:integrase
MKIKISKASVERLKPGEFGWDRDLAGFGVKVTEGGKRVYVVQYRAPGAGSVGKPREKTAPRRYTLGTHGDLTAEEARTLARTVLSGIRHGKDPRDAVLQQRATPTLAEFAKLYQSKRTTVTLFRKKRAAKKVRSKEEDDRNLRLHIKPALGSKKLTEISRDDIEDLHKSMADKPIGANRCLALLSNMINVAMAAGDMPKGENPCRHVAPYPEKGRERHLSDDELSRLGAALTAAEGKETDSAIACIRLLILTGCRLNEILSLKWDWVRLEERCLRLPTSKTGPKVVPLASLAVDLFSSLPRERGNPYVIIGAKTGGHLKGIQRPWQRIRKRAGLDDLRIHDLRHAFASTAASRGESLLIVGRLLGHRQAKTTERYAHTDVNPLLIVADRTATRINEAMGRPPAAPAAEVVAFPKRRRRAKRA